MISNFAAALSAMIGATFWARFFPVFALGPALVGLGVLFDNQTMVDWGTSFQTDNLWIFLGGLAMIVAMTLILISGIKTTFRWQNVFWSIAMIGTFIAFIAFLVGNTADFTANFNELNAQFGGGTTDDIIAAAGTAGVTPELSNLDATFPAVFAIMTFLMWNWWSVYLSGELKSGSDRRRQLSVMFGGLLWDGVFIVMGLVLFFNVIPYDLAAALNTSGNEAYAIPSGPWYQFLASLVQNIGILAVIILGSFLFWSLPAMVGQHLHANPVGLRLGVRSAPAGEARRGQRADPLAGAGHPAGDDSGHRHARLERPVDRLLHVAGAGGRGRRGLRDHRGHRRHPVPDPPPDLYQASPANVKFLGFPLFYVVGPLSILVMLFLVWLTVTYPGLALAGNPDNLWQIPGFMGMIVVIGLALYYGAKFVRRGQGSTSTSSTRSCRRSDLRAFRGTPRRWGIDPHPPGAFPCRRLRPRRSAPRHRARLAPRRVGAPAPPWGCVYRGRCSRQPRDPGRYGRRALCRAFRPGR